MAQKSNMSKGGQKKKCQQKHTLKAPLAQKEKAKAELDKLKINLTALDTKRKMTLATLTQVSSCTQMAKPKKICVLSSIKYSWDCKDSVC